jgi:hypothetical protein
MARIGSVPAAPFVGSEFVSLYLGATRVPTVPGKPVITSAVADAFTEIYWDAPSNDGGSAILSYKLYVDGALDSVAQIDLFGANSLLGHADSEARVSAVNAIGEGPLSNPVVVTDD